MASGQENAKLQLERCFENWRNGSGLRSACHNPVGLNHFHTEGMIPLLYDVQGRKP